MTTTRVSPAEPPELPAVPTGPGTFKVWCEYCKASPRKLGVWHHHGGLGHRVAHCRSTASPYYDTGYVLVLEGPAK